MHIVYVAAWTSMGSMRQCNAIFYKSENDDSFPSVVVSTEQKAPVMSRASRAVIWTRRPAAVMIRQPRRFAAPASCSAMASECRLIWRCGSCRGW